MAERRVLLCSVVSAALAAGCGSSGGSGTSGSATPSTTQSASDAHLVACETSLQPIIEANAPNEYYIGQFLPMFTNPSLGVIGSDANLDPGPPGTQTCALTFSGPGGVYVLSWLPGHTNIGGTDGAAFGGTTSMAGVGPPNVVIGRDGALTPSSG